jgi:hypothetical protein
MSANFSPLRHDFVSVFLFLTSFLFVFCGDGADGSRHDEDSPLPGADPAQRDTPNHQKKFFFFL